MADTLGEIAPSPAGHAPRGCSSGWFPTLVVAVFLAFSTWIITEQVRLEREREDRFDQRFQDMSRALVNLVTSQLYLGTFAARERLALVLEALVQSNRMLQGVALCGESDTVLAVTTREGMHAPLMAAARSGGTTGADADEEDGPPGSTSLLVRAFDFPATDADGHPVDTNTPGARPIVLEQSEFRPLVREVLGPRTREAGTRPTADREHERRLRRERLLKALAADATRWAHIRRFAVRKVVFLLDGRSFMAGAARAPAQAVLVILLAAVAAWAILRAWRNLQRSADLTVRLVQEREKNRHLEEMRLAAAGLAHETRNPLNVVRSIAQSLPLSREDPEKLEEEAAIIVDEVDRINGRLSEFIAYSRPPVPNPATIALAAPLEVVARLLASDAEEKDIALRVEGETGAVYADEGLLRQCVFNLAVNAVEATPRGGHIVLRHGRGEDDKAWIEVADDGPGVPADAREDVFKPYFTLNPSGTGLGLAVVAQITAAHGWTRRYVDRPGPGAVFRIEGIEAR